MCFLSVSVAAEAFESISHSKKQEKHVEKNVETDLSIRSLKSNYVLCKRYLSYLELGLNLKREGKLTFDVVFKIAFSGLMKALKDILLSTTYSTS